MEQITHLIFDNKVPDLNIVLTEETRNWSWSIMYFTKVPWIAIWKEEFEFQTRNIAVNVVYNIYFK